MYKHTIEERLDELSSSRRGLSEEERALRHETYGYNELSNKENRSFFSFYGESLRLPILRILLLIGLLFAIVQRFEEALILFGIFLLRSITEGLKSYRAQRARREFFKQNTRNCKVLQGEKIIELPIRELVPGDIVLLDEGEIIPADGRLIEGDNLWIDESRLTGEDKPFCKDVSFITEENIPLAERMNMVYASTLVCEGQGLMIVTSTGMETEFGKVAFMLYKDEVIESPLDIKLLTMTKYTKIFIVLLSIGFAIYSFLMGRTIEEVVFVSIALVLAATPNTLNYLVFHLMSFGALRFSKNGVTLKRLNDIEKLSSISVVLFDEEPFLTDDSFRVKDISTTTEEDEILIKKICLLAASENAEAKKETLKALRRFVIEENTDLDRSLEAYSFIKSFPAKEGSDMQGSYYQIGDKDFSYVLGSLEEVLEISSFYNLDNDPLPITEEVRQGIQSTNAQFIEEGKKVFAMACKEEDSIETGKLNFLGLIALGDQGRSGAKETIKTLKNAGIRPILLSKSPTEHAFELAKELGILIPGYEVMTSEAMSSLSKEDFENSIENYSVYTNLSLDQRIQLIEGWKNKGASVAITADEIEDTGAFEAADISISASNQKFGVVKQMAQMILPEDNLGALTEAIANARMVYYNLRRKVRFELSISLGLILSMVSIMLLFNDFAFSYLALLWLGFVVSAFPSLALEKEVKERNTMVQAPPELDKGLITRRSFVLTMIESILIAAVSVGGYYALSASAQELARTLTYSTFGFAILFQAFSLRNSQSVLGEGFFSNKSFFIAFMLAGALLLIPTLVPYVNTIFGMTNLPVQYWGLALGLGFSPMIVTEIRKIFIKE